MRETLLINGRSFIFVCIVTGLFLCNCKESIEKKKKNMSIFDTTIEIQDRKPELGDIEIETIFSDEELAETLSELLGCNQRTSQSILNTLNRYSDDPIINITKDESSKRTRLFLSGREGNRYLAVMGRGYVVEALYRNDENGEQIYRIFQ